MSFFSLSVLNVVDSVLCHKVAVFVHATDESPALHLSEYAHNQLDPVSITHFIGSLSDPKNMVADLRPDEKTLPVPVSPFGSVTAICNKSDLKFVSSLSNFIVIGGSMIAAKAGPRRKKFFNIVN